MRLKSKTAFFVIAMFILGCWGPKEIVIKIGNKEITKDKFIKLFSQYKEKMSGSPAATRANLVFYLIEEEILTSESKKLGVSLTSKEIKEFMEENSLQSTHEDTARIFLLRQKMSEKLAENITIDQTRIKAIEKELSDVEPDKLVFYQILVSSMEQAKAALEEINKGMDFQEAAKKYSISPEGKRGGIVDYLNTEELPVEISRALKDLPNGGTTGIIQSPYGFHVLKLKEMIKRKYLSKEEKTKKAENEAKKEKAGEVYAEWLAKKREEYRAEIKWEIIEQIN